MAASAVSVLKKNLPLTLLNRSGTSPPAREANMTILCGITDNASSAVLHLFSTIYNMILNHLKYGILYHSGVRQKL